MPFNRPDLTELIQRTSADVVSRLDFDELRRSDALVIARVQAAVEHGLYGFIEWVARQISPFTCDGYELIHHHAALRDIQRLPAAAATGSATLTGMVGAVIPAGTLLQRIDGVQYQSQLEVTFTTTNVVVQLQAMVAGLAGSAIAATPLALVSPLSGVQSAAVVGVGGLVGGADLESVDSLRSRVIADWQQPAHGGADFDYIEWAKAVAGVTRVWVRPLLLGVGTVVVLFVRDGDASLIPDAGEVAAVQAAIDAVSPVTAAVTVLAPIAKPIQYTIAISATLAVKAAIEAELRDLHAREAEPGGALLISHIREAISSAEGEVDHLLVSPTANVLCNATEIATFGGITWQ